MEQLIILEITDNVAYITLNRPLVFNSFNRNMALELQAALLSCQNSPDVRAVYLTGAGRAFCAGQDLGEITGDNPPTISTILQEHFNPIIVLLRNMPMPIVAAVNGVAAGAGANIALACDVVVAHKNANFIQAFSKIGLIPDSGGTYTLPRLVGQGRASALMLLGDKVSAAEAVDMGMIYKVFDDENFVIESKKIAETLSKMPTQALALTKKALNAAQNNTLEEQLNLEDTLQAEAAQTHDFKEGVAAFIQKRPSVFLGK